MIVSLDIARRAKLKIVPTHTVLKNVSDSTMTLYGQSRVQLPNDKHLVETTVLIFRQPLRGRGVGRPHAAAGHPSFLSLKFFLTI